MMHDEKKILVIIYYAWYCYRSWNHFVLYRTSSRAVITTFALQLPIFDNDFSLSGCVVQLECLGLIAIS